MRIAQKGRRTIGLKENAAQAKLNRNKKIVKKKQKDKKKEQERERIIGFDQNINILVSD